jgi:two-component system, chemotaxis family, CheB/CheR fusion protein
MVVGIGASAGGLDPCRRFFTEMPPDSGMAFVVIQHLDPVHKSETVSLLAHCTKMEVLESSDRARVEPNHVYVIPPNRALAIRAGRLRLTEPIEAHGRRLPIDFFFRSLASECQERAIGMIFSGTGSDGTAGLQAIKVAGGLTIAQDPQTAEHEGMPRSAIGSGVDLVLAVPEIPGELIKYAKHPYLRRSGETATISGEGRDHFQSILSLLRTRAKFDFGSYKRGTLQRRVQRRMSLRHIVRIEDYLNLLRRDGDEVGALLKDLLISVTHFFREPDAWKVLHEQAIRPLIAEKNDDQPIRVWAPGCATGEEAYSIGMTVLDELSVAGKNCAVNIFASDVNKEAFASARSGLYPESVAAEVGPQRLRRYFVREREHYRIRKELRDVVVFAEHNLLTDPPFSRLDLVSCRNLMIYLDASAQKKVIAVFHYALREGGYLFLGSAETTGERHDLFRAVSRKWRLYRRIGPARSEPMDFPLDSNRAPAQPRTANPPPPTTGTRFTELAQQLILDRHAPASVVINQKQEILYTCGSTQDYLKQPTGVMHTDLWRWVTESLRSKLRAALKKVQASEQAVTLSRVRVRRGNSTRATDITIEPLKAPRQAEGLILVTFHDLKSGAPPQQRPAAAQNAVEDESIVHQLEDELKNTREDLQSNIDQLAASNEELKASNEEVTSVNEELQSTNEEMETSKEELQSLNEELSTVNSQLQLKVEELETKTNDLNNLLSSTEIATIFLDRQFQIKWFTSPTTRLLRLRPADVGRPIADFAQKFTGGDLLRDANEVLHKLTPIERDVRGQDGHWYLRRVLPYRTADNRIDGVVVTFVDIHASRMAEEKMRHLATVLRDSYDAVTVHDFDGRILAWNHGAEVMFGYTEAEALRRNILSLVPHSKRDEMRALFHRLDQGEEITSLETQRKIKGGGVLDVWLTITALLDDDGRPTAIATTERDISQRKRDEAALRELNNALEKRVAERSALAEQQAERLRELAAQLLETEEQERRNLAADLHDNLAQVLHVAKMKLSELRAAAGDGRQELFKEIETLLGRANHSARSLSYQLSPPVLYELGLVPALEWLGEEMKRQYRLDVKVANDNHVQSLDERTRVVLFRAVRELLVNVSKHAGVHRAHVRIRRKGKFILASVEDHGVGFDPKVIADPKKTQGLGLFNIRERLDYLGGSMEIDSATGKKTAITLAVPVVMEKKRATGRRQ